MRNVKSQLEDDVTVNIKAAIMKKNREGKSQLWDIQVHLKKIEYREIVLFFVTLYFKKWNFHIL